MFVYAVACNILKTGRRLRPTFDIMKFNWCLICTTYLSSIVQIGSKIVQLLLILTCQQYHTFTH